MEMCEGAGIAYLIVELGIGDVAQSLGGTGTENVEVDGDANGLSTEVGLEGAVGHDLSIGSNDSLGGLGGTTLALGSGEGGQSQSSEDVEEHDVGGLVGPG